MKSLQQCFGYIREKQMTLRWEYLVDCITFLCKKSWGL